MDSIADTSTHLMPYVPGFVALCVLCLVVLAQSFLAGILALAPGHQSPGSALAGTHEEKSFRVMRTYANSTENLPAIMLAAALAMIAGVGPFWVNLLIGLHVVLRILFWAIYYAGIGAHAGGPRSIIYVLGLLANIVLGAMALWAFTI